MDYGLQSTIARANLFFNIVSVIQAGTFAGCFFSIWLANRIGRRMSLIFTSTLAFIGVTMQAVAKEYIISLYVGRFNSGVGRRYCFHYQP